MAEGAHLTSAVTGDKPSIFEVLAQESLISTLRPALKHASRVLAESRPERFSWLLHHYEEIYTLLEFLLQHYHLRKYSASFSEHFYDLKRVCPNNVSTKLPRRVIWKSLLCLVFLPYFKQKLDKLFEDLRHAYNTYTPNTGMARLGQVFVSVYPYVHTAWEGAVLSYQMAYMFGKTEWHSPFLRFAGVTLTMEQDPEPGGQRSPHLPWQQLSLWQQFSVLMKKLVSMMAVTVSTGLSVGVFFIQFLDWWYSSESSSAASLTSLPVPDPPQEADTRGATQFGVCPICHRTRSNDTALSVSGYVFCYPCIYDYVNEYQICPVTRFPAQTEHLIKLYISQS